MSARKRLRESRLNVNVFGPAGSQRPHAFQHGADVVVHEADVIPGVKLANRLAEEAGAKAFVIASAVGAVKGADNYIAASDYNITTLAKALR